MKKRIVLTMVAVMGIFAISPLSDAVNRKSEDVMYAKTASQYLPEDSSDATIVDNDIVTENQKEDIVEKDTNLVASRNQNIDQVKNQDRVINKVRVRKTEKLPTGKDIVKDTNNVKTSTKKEQLSNKSLNKEEALNVLKNQGTNLEYSYMGDEKDYSVLKEKGHEGYVFLPNTNTDMGLFVDKNTKEVYYFHPSGYIDQY